MKLVCLTLLAPLLVAGCAAPNATPVAPSSPDAQMARYIAGQQALANIQRQQEINAQNNEPIGQYFRQPNYQPLPVQPIATPPSGTFFIHSPSGSRTVMQMGNSLFIH